MKVALSRQTALNNILQPYGAFVLAADLEGLLIDVYGWKGLVSELGPLGVGEIDTVFAERLLAAPDGAAQLASWLGSKGWNSDGKKSGKLQPHLPAI
ncbi:hypothetical protein AB4Z22_44490, partial [Paenibacillus sp. TAF58]